MKTWLVALTAALILTSCLPAPFDLQISLAAATAQKMNLDTASPIPAGSYSSDQVEQLAFFPSVLAAGGFDYRSGIVAVTSGSNVSVRGVAGGSTFGQAGQGVMNPDPHAPSFMAWPLKTGQSALGIAFDAVSPSASGYALFQGNPSTQTLTPVSGPLGGLDPSAAAVIGVSIQFMPASYSYDMLHVLSVDASGTLFREGSWQVTSTGLPVETFPHGSGFFSLPWIAGATRVMYFYDEDVSGDASRLPNRSFACWYSGGSWQTWAWSGSPGAFASTELPIDHRVDSLLTTGQLLSTEDGTGRLYDRDGGLLATFPLGNLVYIGEQYVGGVPRCYFSQALVYEKTLHFNVYWIATDQLATLGS